MKMKPCGINTLDSTLRNPARDHYT